jgi:hypothetical protein
MARHRAVLRRLMQFRLANSLPSSTISAIQNWTKEIPVFIILITAITLNRHGIYAHRDFPLGRRALRPLARKFAAALFTVRIVGVGFLAIPTLTGSAAYAFAPRPGQEIEVGTRVLRPHFPLDGGGRRTGFRRHYSCEGALLDSCYQWIVNPIPSRSNPGHCFRQQADAGPTKVARLTRYPDWGENQWDSSALPIPDGNRANSLGGCGDD